MCLCFLWWCVLSMQHNFNCNHWDLPGVNDFKINGWFPLSIDIWQRRQICLSAYIKNDFWSEANCIELWVPALTHFFQPRSTHTVLVLSFTHCLWVISPHFESTKITNSSFINLFLTVNVQIHYPLNNRKSLLKFRRLLTGLLCRCNFNY